MTHERVPARAKSLVGEGTPTTAWEDARRRLSEPEPGRSNWIATVRSDGRPHLMPVLAFWLEDAFHMVIGEGTQKARNLAADRDARSGRRVRRYPRSTSPPRAAAGRSDPAAVARITELLKANGWPLEVDGVEVTGPSAPSAGPPPYRIYRMVPTRVFGLPGTYGWTRCSPTSSRSRLAGTSNRSSNSGLRRGNGRAGPVQVVD